MLGVSLSFSHVKKICTFFFDGQCLTAWQGKTGMEGLKYFPKINNMIAVQLADKSGIQPSRPETSYLGPDLSNQELIEVPYLIRNLILLKPSN